jgi:ribosomal protein S18 acetylase RimI-like enzyme
LIEVRRVRAADWQTLREVRLRALADAPNAFGTVHSEAQARPDEWWRDWAERSASSSEQAMFLAWDDDEAVGIAGIFGDAGRFDVISMWTDPACRGRGVAGSLLEAALAFAKDTPVFLSVTENNDVARRLYERRGFVATGLVEPLRSNPRLAIHELKLER